MTKRERWLKERRTLVTASDAAAILGLDPYRGPLSVFAEKRGLVEVEENDAMYFGKLLEDDIAQGYARKTERRVFPSPAYEIQRHPDIPWLGATLDRQTEDSALSPRPLSDLEHGPVPLELKSVGQGQRGSWEEEPPLHYQIQLQIQICVTYKQWGSIAALIGGQALRWADVLRHQAFLDGALPKLEEFWLRVKRNDPPPPDALERTRDVLRAMYPRDEGTTIKLGDDMLQAIATLDELRKRANDAEKEQKAIESQILAAMGTAARGILPDGTVIKCVSQEIAERTQTVKAHIRRPIYWLRGDK